MAFRFKKYGLQCYGTQQVVHLWRDYPTRTSRTDSNYADNRFLALKIHYFLALNYDKKKELVVWGGGDKGKGIAKLLLSSNIPFRWVCNNPKKIGQNVYGVILEDDVQVFGNETQFIIAVAGDRQQNEVKEKLASILAKKEVYFFC